ncbi:MAG: hypothetical protein NZ899_01390, partial [Thermoguttaceae bacterium]|nr:hypothetical protein [Thermoguttaceae bacterium]
MSNTSEPSERRIIIDEDWKQKVEAEREAIRRQQTQKAQMPSGKETPPPGFPEASFEYLLNMLGTQAL